MKPASRVQRLLGRLIDPNSESSHITMLQYLVMSGLRVTMWQLGMSVQECRLNIRLPCALMGPRASS